VGAASSVLAMLAGIHHSNSAIETFGGAGFSRGAGFSGGAGFSRGAGFSLRWTLVHLPEGFATFADGGLKPAAD